MKAVSIKTILSIFLLCLASSRQVVAVEQLEIKVQGSDVVLEWPSIEGETYLLTWRATYETNTPWVWLSTNWLAATGTNRTQFIHTNGAECSGGGSMMMSGGGSGGSGEGAAKSSGSEAKNLPKRKEPLTIKDYTLPALSWNEKTQADIAFNYPGLLPQLPWNEKTQKEIVYLHELEVARLEAAAGGGMAAMGSGSNCVPAGFYKVVRQGIHFFGLTNGTHLTGYVEIPVEVGLVDNSPTTVHLYGGSLTADKSRVEKRSDGSLIACWNTAYFPNGTNPINPSASIGQDTLIVGTTNFVVVSNAVTLNSFTDTFGSQLWVNAKLVLTNADFEVRMLDQGGTYLGSFFGSTTNGFISLLWDLTTNGQPVNSSRFTAQFRAAPPGSPLGNVPVTPQTLNQESSWSEDDFIVAWGDFTHPIHPTSIQNLGDMVQNNIVDLLGDFFADNPYELSDGNAISVFGGGTFFLTPTNRAAFLETLAAPRFRNFWWSFHGNTDNIGYPNNLDSNTNPVPESGVSIRDTEIASILGNQNGTNNHPYRFVILDGCATADGGLSKAFGIESHQVSIEEYSLRGTRPRAFIGNVGICSSGITPEEIESKGRAYARFFARWMAETYSVQQCLDAGQAPDGIFPEDPLSAQLTIFGAVDMRRLD